MLQANRHLRGGRKNHYRNVLRRLTVAPDGDGQTPVPATNNLDSPARTIAKRYQARWGIEVFFKWIKQFLGRNENAVRIQILTALIAYLLALYRQVQRYRGSLWSLLAEVRATLFQRPGIEREWYRRRRNAQAEFASRQGGFFL